VTYQHKSNQVKDSGMGKMYHVSDPVKLRREYGKENICKLKRTNSIAQSYIRSPCHIAAIYGNLWQSVAIYGNLPVPITLLGTIITYTITARKEGKRSTYIDIQTA
jgi:hypothetical protein